MHDHYDRLPGGVTVVPGKSSSFEVFLGERRVFSKLESERFPEENEVEEKIGELLEATSGGGVAEGAEGAEDALSR